jgi:deoxycytidine triphosphate deaminase
MTLGQGLDLEFATSEQEAIGRAEKFKRVDPFPDIPPALLSSADIEDYARVTAMLLPFSVNADALKPASYEVRPGRKFVWWRDNGELVEEDVREDQTYELPPNSIRYMQIEPKIRLPDYIAIRFNLRIKHVHRGLLLGTGPLIDPGFDGDILIPLHNLTSESHRIRGNEGLIWVEFTKTAARVERASPSYTRRGELHKMEKGKIEVSISSYFQRANEGRPIRSSIPEAVREATSRAEQAERSVAQAAQSANRTGIIGGITAVALIVTLVIGLHTYFAQLYGDIQATLALVSTVSTNASQAQAGATKAIENEQALRRDLEAARGQIESLRGQLENMTQVVDQMRRPTSPAVRSPVR